MKFVIALLLVINILIFVRKVVMASAASYFCSELTIHQFAALLNARKAEDDKELDAAASEYGKMKRPKQTLARLAHPDASSTLTSAPLAPAPLGTTPPPSPRMRDTGRSRTPPPDRPRPIGMHPGPSLTEPSPSTGAPSSPTLPPRTVYAGFEQGPMKGKPSPQTTIGTGKGPSKSAKLLFHRCNPKKVIMLPAKGERKARIRARTRVAMKATVKVRVKTKKVDRTESPPFKLVLWWIFNLLLCFFASLPLWHAATYSVGLIC